uniref:Uncharacterized protein n=1 Tax=Candidatus Methanophagaceae archaeon ANME-1 ERB6 TaxID=2759912 RepID=A0A7G9Z105_9EURY|nr:hypothetical protein NNHBGCAA_00039 [Methanosarcinales archaeon ANME-1 ERB6]
MDVEDIIVLIISAWAVVSFSLIKSIEVYLTLLLIGLLVVMEVAGSFINPEIRKGLKPAIYFILFVFFIIIAKKVIEVTS